MFFRRGSSSDRESMKLLPHVIRPEASRFLDRFNCQFNAKTLFLMFLFFVYTFILLYVSGSYSLESNSRYPRSGHVRYRHVDDYDIGCNGYSLDYRIEEQRRILASVRNELTASSKKLEEVNSVVDELNRKIPEKQSELSAIGDEIETAERTLLELRDRRNVRVYLPHRPLLANRSSEPFNERSTMAVSTGSYHMEDTFDYSRCSITSFFPIFLHGLVDGSGKDVREYFQQFQQQGNIVSTEESACVTVTIVNGSLPNSRSDKVLSSNQLIINVGRPFELKSTGREILVQQSHTRRHVDFALHLDVPVENSDLWKSLPTLLPYTRKTLILLLLFDEVHFDSAQLTRDVTRLLSSADASSDHVEVVRCHVTPTDSRCTDPVARVSAMHSSMFCLMAPGEQFQRSFWESLRAGCVPVVMSTSVPLPFEGLVDWRLASYRMAAARLPEAHFVVRSFEMTDVLEMRRMGRVLFETYLADKTVLVRSILAALRERIGVPAPQQLVPKAEPLFNSSFTSPILTPVNVPLFDEEHLGPLEAAVDSPAFQKNFTSLQMYSYRSWNGLDDISTSAEYRIDSVDPPAETEFYPDSNIGFRPISPGSGDEFSRSLGGNRAREQFTVVMLTFNRDAVLAASLERLHRLPYLNKIVVVWNNIGREPVGAWPRLHVPVEFIRVSNNSLNNRFVPWDRITTEAVLSLDDDIDLKHHEIVFAFRVWRENRDRLVGFPARHHARFGDQMYYNSNHTCQLSIVLTGASFIHKSYLHAYSSRMPSAIRHHVDDVMNCEDIAMNFLIAHLSRRPPIKTTSKWTLRCPTCSEALSQDESHFSERHQCIRLFTAIYGYNPLRFSQFRADSVLFKTRLPADKQKCFKYV